MKEDDTIADDVNILALLYLHDMSLTCSTKNWIFSMHRYELRTSIKQKFGR